MQQHVFSLDKSLVEVKEILRMKTEKKKKEILFNILHGIGKKEVVKDKSITTQNSILLGEWAWEEKRLRWEVVTGCSWKIFKTSEKASTLHFYLWKLLSFFICSSKVQLFLFDDVSWKRRGWPNTSSSSSLVAALDPYGWAERKYNDRCCLLYVCQCLALSCVCKHKIEVIFRQGKISLRLLSLWRHFQSSTGLSKL